MPGRTSVEARESPSGTRRYSTSLSDALPAPGGALPCPILAPLGPFIPILAICSRSARVFRRHSYCRRRSSRRTTIPLLSLLKQGEHGRWLPLLAISPDPIGFAAATATTAAVRLDRPRHRFRRCSSKVKASYRTACVPFLSLPRVRGETCAPISSGSFFLNAFLLQVQIEAFIAASCLLVANTT